MATNKFKNWFLLLVLSVLIPLTISANVNAQTYDVYTVADTGTTMPTQTIAFGDINSPVAITSIESEAFFGTSGINEGIYNNFGGTLNVIANQATPAPGTLGNFTGFLTRPINLENAPDVAFSARSFGRVGMYTRINGVFEVVLDSSMNLPGVIGTNASFVRRPVHLGGNDIGFTVTGLPGEEAIFVFVGGVLELVADTGTPIPGGTGNFTSMTFLNVLDDNTLIFLGQGSGGQRGYYAYVGGSIVTLVDTNTPIPDGIGNFTNFSQQPEGIGGANLVFAAFGSGGQTGIYSIIGGVLDVVVDENDFYPGTTDVYTGFGSQPQHLGGGNFVVQANGFGGQIGVIRVVGGVDSVAIDNTDPIPGGTGNFNFFRRLTPLGGLDFAFEGEGPSSQRGIYTLISGVNELVADRNTPVPGGSGGNFNDFSFLISLGDGDVGFRGGELGTGASDGLYDFIGGELGLVANNFVTPVPDSFGIFFSFSDIDRIPGTKEMAFFATSPALQGLYTHINLNLGFVADITTLIPGGNEPGATFRRFTDPVSIGNDDVVFFADGTDFELGFYSFISSSLAVVADLNTPIPGGTGNFTSFPICSAGGGGGGGGGIVGGIDLTTEDAENVSRGEEPPLEPGNIVSPSDGNMAFLGAGSGGQVGIYSSIGGVLGVIVDTTTPIPGGTGNFTNYTCVVSLGNGEVAFIGEGSGGQNGIYTTVGGVPTLIADLNTPVPGGTGNYIAFGMPVSIDDGNVAFIGTDSGFQQGIYRSIGGILSTVADSNTAVPGGGGNFFLFLDPVSISGGNLTFTAFSSLSGVYTFIDGVLDVLVDSNSTLPGSTSTFTNFGQPAANPAGDIAFRAFGSGGERGVYAVVVGNLFVIRDTNSPIPGGVGNFTQFNDVVALTGRDWAFRAQGTFDQVGIYNAILGTGSLTIVKETNPPGGTGFGFEGTNLSMQGCGLDGSFTLDDQGFISCDLVPGSYTVQETEAPNHTLTNIDCVGASSFSETEDSVTVNLEVDEIVVCTFTNTLNFVLNPIFPALDDNINSISAEQAVPGGNVAFVWGKATGSTIIGRRVCNGLELGIKNPRILAIVPANDFGVATHIFYIPTFGDLAFQVQLQAIDINSCRESNVVPQIIRKDESG